MVLIADIYINSIFIIILGAVTGIMASCFRVGGALVTVPFLLLLKIPIVTIVATQPFIMFSGAFFSVINNRKNIDFSQSALKVNYLLAIGLLVGVFCGFELLKYFSTINGFEFYYFYTYLFITGFFGFTILRQAFSPKYKENNELNINKTNYKKSSVVTAGFLASFFSSMLSLGGNVFLMPLLTSFAKLPVSFIKNNSYISLAMLTLISSFLAFIQLKAFDFMLASLTLIGVVFGTKIGTILNKYISYNKTRMVPGLILIVISCLMIYKKIIA